MSKIGEKDNLNNKAQVLEQRGRPNKGFSLTSTKSTVEAIDSFKKLQESNKELKNKMEHLKRYSRDFNIILIGVEEEQIKTVLLLFQTTSHFLASKRLMEN